MDGSTPEDKGIKIRHDTFTKEGKPITVIKEGDKEREVNRGMDKVDPEGLERTKDRRTG